MKTYSTQQKYIDYLEKAIWNCNVTAPYDPTSKVWKCRNNQYKCKNTNKFFNVKTGTFLANTKIQFPYWFIAFWYVSNHKKGMAALQLRKEIQCIPPYSVVYDS